MTRFIPARPYNFTKWTSPEYDQLVTQAARETDVLKRTIVVFARGKNFGGRAGGDYSAVVEPSAPRSRARVWNAPTR